MNTFTGSWLSATPGQYGSWSKRVQMGAGTAHRQQPAAARNKGPGRRARNQRESSATEAKNPANEQSIPTRVSQYQQQHGCKKTAAAARTPPPTDSSKHSARDRHIWACTDQPAPKPGSSKHQDTSCSRDLSMGPVSLSCVAPTSEGQLRLQSSSCFETAARSVRSPDQPRPP